MMEMLQGSAKPADIAFAGGVIALAALICLLYYMFLFSPAQNRIAELESENRTLMADIREAESIEAGIEELRRRSERMDLLVGQFEQRLPQQREIPQLITEFEMLAQRVGIEIEVSQMSVQRDERKETIPYSVVAFGSFHQIAHFINELERFDRYLKVSNLNIEEERERISRAAFTLSTFRFLEAAPAMAGDTAQAGASAS